MGNTEHIQFDLEQLYNSMLESGVDPQKSMMEFSPDEMDWLGRCYLSAAIANTDNNTADTDAESIDEDTPF